MLSPIPTELIKAPREKMKMVLKVKKEKREVTEDPEEEEEEAAEEVAEERKLLLRLNKDQSILHIANKA